MIFSKFQTIDTTCMEYVHPWSNSCTYASLSLLKPCIRESFRIYVVAYSISLLFKGRIPKKKDIKNTILGILQSCLFLTFHGVGYSGFNCFLRRIIGNFNFYTVSFLPSFISSIIAILIERPSRRGLLSLYVTNVASETVFRMAVARKLITPVRYGEVLIFAISISYLIYMSKSRTMPKDPVHSFIRYLVGKNEQKGYVKEQESPTLEPVKIPKKQNIFFIEWYHNKLMKLKSLPLHSSCPHYNSCLYYILSGGIKKFIQGYVIQLSIQLLLNLKKVVIKPSLLFGIPFRVDTMKLGICLGSFTSIFRIVSCYLRRLFDEDSKYTAIPAGFLAGLSFFFYRDVTIALYVMWKTFQVCYNFAAEDGYVTELPWAPVFFHAFSTAVLFHVALLEPSNLRRSYWNFLQAMSGARIADMDRKCLDAFGLKTSKSLAKVLAKPIKT